MIKAIGGYLEAVLWILKLVLLVALLGVVGYIVLFGLSGPITIPGLLAFVFLALVAGGLVIAIRATIDRIF